MSERFDPRALSGLPPTARRYLRHAIAPGTPIAASVRLETRFTMRLRESDRRGRRLVGREHLAAAAFEWRGWTRMGGLPIRVTDDYRGGAGGVRVQLFGFVPLVRACGPEVSRSARGRLAAESIWLPSVLLPDAGVTWTQVGDDVARVRRMIDGEPVTLTMEVDGAGRPIWLSMERFGDVGVESWQPIPYGVDLVEEGTFGGYTVPTHAVGGWWYGSDRYDPATASHFRVADAAFS